MKFFTTCGRTEGKVKGLGGQRISENAGAVWNLRGSIRKVVKGGAEKRDKNYTEGDLYLHNVRKTTWGR